MAKAAPVAARAFLFAAALSSLINATSGLAESNYDGYRDALRIADRKVSRLKRLDAGNSSSLTSGTISRFFGRYYRVGDSWEVLAFQTEATQARMTSDPEQLQPRKGRGGVFVYEVVAVKTGSEPQVTLKVTQKADFGLKAVDARVKFLTLTMNDRTIQSKKAYAFEGEPRLTEVSPNGLHSAVTPLELYPLDVPEVFSGESAQARELPSLPAWIQSYAQKVGYGADLSRSTWIEQDDFFGRPVQLLWQQGDPWPTYLKTSQGIAVLIRKRTSS